MEQHLPYIHEPNDICLNLMNQNIVPVHFQRCNKINIYCILYNSYTGERNLPNSFHFQFPDFVKLRRELQLPNPWWQCSTLNWPTHSWQKLHISGSSSAPSDVVSSLAPHWPQHGAKDVGRWWHWKPERHYLWSLSKCIITGIGNFNER